MGGKFGNTHIALGKAYLDCYRGDWSQISTEEFAELGYNDSSVHTDIISTTDRTVTATLPDGSEKIIYQKECLRCKPKNTHPGVLDFAEFLYQFLVSLGRSLISSIS